MLIMLELFSNYYQPFKHMDLTFEGVLGNIRYYNAGEKGVEYI